MPLFPTFEQREQPEANPVMLDNWIHGYCAILEGESSEFGETWPTVFAALPRVGDFVLSSKGSTLKVIRVIHTLNENNQPRIELELGRERTAAVSTMFG